MRDRKPRFIDANAVDAWDAWFRWRHQGLLRDISIEDTWARVTAALAAAERPDQAGPFAARLVDALSAWKLLPDARIVGTAGTDRPAWPGDDLAAVLNAVRFVRAAAGGLSFDHADCAATAALAVRMLDNAALLAPSAAGLPRGQLRIGLIGLADALALLGLPYDSAEARAEAGRIARSLAEGCLQGDVRLARERGARPQATPVARPLELLASLDADWRRTGLRHTRLTAITSQRRLALLANNVADALDPLSAPLRTRSIAGQPSQPGVGRLPPSPAVPTASLQAQLLLRGAMQPWIDLPIDYAVAATHAEQTPAPADEQLARACGLGPLRLRRPGEPA